MESLPEAGAGRSLVGVVDRRVLAEEVEGLLLDVVVLEPARAVEDRVAREEDMMSVAALVKAVALMRKRFKAWRS